MRELVDDIDAWRQQGLDVAIARVVAVEGSAPRGPGAAMAVDERGEVIGSLSGGCVEGAVVSEALDVLTSGERKLVTFGYDDDQAFAVGLTCGGTIHVFLEPLDWERMGPMSSESSDTPPAPEGPGLFDELAAALRDDRAVALATVLEGPAAGRKLLVRPGHADGEVMGTLGDPELDRQAVRTARGDLAAGRTAVRNLLPCAPAGAESRSPSAAESQPEPEPEPVAVFVESFVPAPRMLVVGAVDFSAALVRVAKVLGYRVTVCDARAVFATARRFPEADEVVVEWPQRLLERVGATLTDRDAVCVLTHDARFDVPVLVAALRAGVGYVGAMGSRRTHADRVLRLKEAGLEDDDLARIRSPIGLDLGARTPEETAVAICAEIIADHNGRADPRPLRDTHGPIH